MSHIDRFLQQLNRWIDEDHVAQTYILAGGQKEDRREIAQYFAKKLITSPADLIYPTHEKEGLFSVAEVREQIGESVIIRPYGEKKKVYVVEDAELLNTAAQNALLKTLEEPPEYVVILLLSDSLDVFLPTVLSRAVKITLPKKEESLEISDKETLEEEKKLLVKGARMTPMDLADYESYLKKEHPDEKIILAYVREWFRDVMVLKQTGQSIGYEELIKKEQATVSFEALNRILSAAAETEQYIRSNVNKDLCLCMLFQTIKKELSE